MSSDVQLTNPASSQTASANVFTLEKLDDLSADDLAETFKQGDIEVVIEGALGEWGSRLEGLIQKLEKGVMGWYDEGTNRTLSIRFVEQQTDSAKVATS